MLKSLNADISVTLKRCHRGYMYKLVGPKVTLESVART